MICPKCKSENVKPIESWEISEFKVKTPVTPMWACLNPLCLHKWLRDRQD